MKNVPPLAGVGGAGGAGGVGGVGGAALLRAFGCAVEERGAVACAKRAWGCWPVATRPMHGTMARSAAVLANGPVWFMSFMSGGSCNNYLAANGVTDGTTIVTIVQIRQVRASGAITAARALPTRAHKHVQPDMR